MRQGLASRLDQRLLIERQVAAQRFRGAGKGAWEPVAEVYAEVRDMLPSRAERVDAGINMARRPARVRMRFRADVTSAMRFTAGERVMQVVSGPAAIERGALIEFMVEDYSTAGNAA